MKNQEYPKDKITESRQRINQIDRQIVQLLDERLHLAYKIGEMKQILKIQVLDEQRETEVYHNIHNVCTNMLTREQLDLFYEQIIKLGRYFGEKGRQSRKEENIKP